MVLIEFYKFRLVWPPLYYFSYISIGEIREACSKKLGTTLKANSQKVKSSKN